MSVVNISAHAPTDHAQGFHFSIEKERINNAILLMT